MNQQINMTQSELKMTASKWLQITYQSSKSLQKYVHVHIVYSDGTEMLSAWIFSILNLDSYVVLI